MTEAMQVQEVFSDELIIGSRVYYGAFEAFVAQTEIFGASISEGIDADPKYNPFLPFGLKRIREKPKPRYRPRITQTPLDWSGDHLCPVSQEHAH